MLIINAVAVCLYARFPEKTKHHFLTTSYPRPLVLLTCLSCDLAFCTCIHITQVQMDPLWDLLVYSLPANKKKKSRDHYINFSSLSDHGDHTQNNLFETLILKSITEPALKYVQSTEQTLR